MIIKNYSVPHEVIINYLSLRKYRNLPRKHRLKSTESYRRGYNNALEDFFLFIRTFPAPKKIDLLSLALGDKVKIEG